MAETRAEERRERKGKYFSGDRRNFAIIRYYLASCGGGGGMTG